MKQGIQGRGKLYKSPVSVHESSSGDLSQDLTWASNPWCKRLGFFEVILAPVRSCKWPQTCWWKQLHSQLEPLKLKNKTPQLTKLGLVFSGLWIIFLVSKACFFLIIFKWRFSEPFLFLLFLKDLTLPRSLKSSSGQNCEVVESWLQSWEEEKKNLSKDPDLNKV